MLVVTRFVVAEADGAAFGERVQATLAAFAACPGFVRARGGRAADDPRAWCLVTEWESVGAYRRALSRYDVKVYATPMLAEALDEPGAYEILVAAEDGELTTAVSARAPNAGTTRTGDLPSTIHLNESRWGTTGP